MSITPGNPLSPAAVRSLLNAAARLRQQGDTRRARMLLRALAVQCPNNPWVWRALADVAENEQERRAALRCIVALVRSTATPGTMPAGPSSMAEQPSPAVSSSTPVAPMPVTQSSAAPHDLAVSPVMPLPPPSLTSAVQASPETPPTFSAAMPSGQSAAPAKQAPRTQPAQTALPSLRRYHWIGVAAIGAALLVFAVLLTNARFPDATSHLTPTTPGSVGGSESSASSPVFPVSSPTTVPTAPAALLQLPVTTTAPADASGPTTTLSPLPISTPPPTLPAGAVVLRDGWTLTLLRPDHALVLSGAIGSRQPNGRFVLALVAVGNGGATAAPAPPTLFVLIDEQGNRYLPEPGLSRFYLETFGRGRYGDFSLDEAIPAGVGQVSVPVIFDVPVGVRSLTLLLGDSIAGWPIIGSP